MLCYEQKGELNMLKGIPISGGRIAEVIFEHLYSPGDKRMVTWCWLMLNDRETWRMGEARLNPGDIFNKNTGRKIALSRAIDAWHDGVFPPFTKEDRTAIWKAYFEARHGKYE